ncbi:MAG: PDZ domain-containing protein [Bacteroidales bacterium]|nr:PDZ domain-containing protein [Bacteroidales bacterium]
MRRVFRYFAISLLTFASLMACGPKDEPITNNNNQNNNGQDPVTPVSTKPSRQIQQADQFAIDALATYYLWSKEIYNDLGKLDPDSCTDPITVVHDIRYHANNKEVDHWTQLTDDLKSMTNSVEGLGLTYGYDLQAGRISNREGVYFLIVTYVTKNSPAEKVGLKRGDIIMKIDGKEITSDNIYDAFNTANVTLGISHLVIEGTNQFIGDIEYDVSMTAEDMWEDPILVDTTYTIGEKTVGYLVYNSFDIKSMETLPVVFRKFKEKGVEELILDLRYNGGGYVKTECELASLIAPYASVVAGDIFQTEVFNQTLTTAWADEDFNTYFSTKFEYKSGDYNISEDISDANLDLKKLYVIVTGGSASASEGLIVGLTPYMDITLIGEQTYGKYCAGYMMSPDNLYPASMNVDHSKINNWGIYVMVSTFADKNGHNPAMPDGIPVNIEVDDKIFDGCQFGDENETMLKAALKAAGKVYTKAPERSFKSLPTEILEHGAPRGILINNQRPLPDLSNIPLR